MDNYTEYRLGLDPRSASRAGYPAGGIQHTATGAHLSLTYRRRQSDASLRYEVESSTDCQNWLPAQVAVTATTDHGDGTETVTVSDTHPVTGQPKGFLRLRVDENPE
jgi:hypothetical protein